MRIATPQNSFRHGFAVPPPSGREAFVVKKFLRYSFWSASTAKASSVLKLCKAATLAWSAGEVL